ncbi:G2/M phase-specific E3 ubiquitin-protein ligase-like [Alosa alosa]|uniref:G2/M phase-specific E3 ubiquitin-protein ligase-like n=1 Tax=Alosa alosa TaxID=278164 RepID=UPI00201520AF|nr:G2/M phase-specific E3 ubiquitin-protein ligase-like [Alosa alosa]
MCRSLEVSQKPVGTPHLNTFMEYRLKKSEERQKFSSGKMAGEKRKAPRNVQLIRELAVGIDHTVVNRFNITRSNVWDGAMRGLKRSTFQDKADFYVKFSDDAGLFEDSIDTGLQKENFCLIMNHLPSRLIFDGPPQHRYLIYNAQAIKDDEYFLAGKLISLSVIQEGPNFLSKTLVGYIVGEQFSASVQDVTEREIGGALSEIESAGSLEHLQDLLVVHSSMLQMAGCFRCVQHMEERHVIVSEYLKWFIIQRNCSVIDRFKEGLASLNFLEALCQHPTAMAPILQHTTTALSPTIIEQLFTPNLSTYGSNRRTEENLVLTFWAEYLLDCEEKGSVCLMELMMFGTGLTAIPPGRMFPRPSITFTSCSRYPLANTCGNTITIPLLANYTLFKENMDFGVQNSPGFGCP